MYSVGGSEAISRDMDNLLFSTNFKYPSQTEFAKSKEMMHSDLYDYNNHHLHQQQQQPPPPPPSQPPQPPRQQQQSSNLARYRSAPSSFFASLINDGVDGNNYTNGESMNPESEMMFPRFNSGEGDSHDLKFGANLKQEMAESANDYSVSASEMGCAAPAPNLNPVTSGISSVENSYRGLNSSMGMENLNQLKKSSGGNCSNLIRQSSSPAGFLSNLVDEIGFGVTSDTGNFRASNQTNREVGSTTSRLSNHMNFASGQSSHSRFMPQITENGIENVGTSSQQNGQLGSGQNGDHSNRHYLPSIPNDSSFTSLKRIRDGEMKMFSNLNGLDTRNSDSKHNNSGLLHQLSLPSTSAEMSTIENLLQFQQDTVVPCKIRAKRGFATHPRSIAERVRRTRISERMKKLQELFPNMDKQANTADMLDLAVEFIKDLQKEVQALNETRARCTCSSKIKQTSPTA